ncbi:MAG: AMP-binding protein, partial [Acidobacteria bacterium]|nr:AMP-binding protein [Acidobacteriota bacterium]
MSDHAVVVYPPAPEFTAQANVKGMDGYRELYAAAAADPEKFWADFATANIDWAAPWTQVLDWSNPPFAKWFVGAKLNVAHNCLDRHLSTDRRDKVAILFEGEPGDSRSITYAELHKLVCRFANVLKGRGLKQGDRAIIYMPMIPEAAVAMLACARLGVIHSVVFGGFSAEALKTRIQDLGAQMVITADGGWRRAKEVKLKPAVDEAVADCPTIQNVIVYQRTNTGAKMTEGRDHWWHELEAQVTSDECPAEPFDSETPLYVLYTSGTTGKPKGILHTSGGYLTQAVASMQWVFDLKENDIYWCSADIGWVTGHSYVVYGPLAAGATVLMYEGTPDTPTFARWWQ